MTGAPIKNCAAQDIDFYVSDLSELLNKCVHAGASVGFVLPHDMSDSRAFWMTKVRPAVEAGRRLVLVAIADERVAGSVQLDCDTPPNQPHRAEVSKLLVHPDFRRRGIARSLMTDLEHYAARSGRRLMTLDTRTGDKAEPLYLSLGFVKVGIIPRFAQDPIVDRLDATTIMFKEI